jgi:hypothetical protein
MGDKIMKKIVYLLFLCGFCFLGCATSQKININDLNSKEFTLNSIELMIYGYNTSMDIEALLKELPIKDAVEKISLKYGIEIDTTFFDDVSFVQKVKQKSLTSGDITVALPDWVVENDVLQNQICDIQFILNVSAEAGQIGLTANISTKVSGENNAYLIGSQDKIKYPGWTF